jgi:predicted permease
MNPTIRAWTEIIFNVVYLVVLWGFIAAMLRRRKFLQPKDRQVGNLFILAFVFLAIGDMGHVGLRALAFAQGQPIAEAQPGDTSLLVGLGALATAITITFFYILMAILWRRRFKKPYGWFGILIILAGFARLIMMVFPQNQWTLIVPPQPWSLYRNIPLMIQGLGVAFLFLRDATTPDDRLYKWVGILILLSFAFYIPVILFVQQEPLIGLLMIPKTLAYLAIAALAYNLLFRSTLPRRKTS